MTPALAVRGKYILLEALLGTPSRKITGTSLSGVTLTCIGIDYTKGESESEIVK
jgi:hypothetical protein